MHEIHVARYSPLLDPALQAWGWEIPVYLFLGGMAAGAMILTALLGARGRQPSRAARRLVLAAPALLSAGMLALFLDLDRKLHVMRFYLAFRWTSPMSWGAWILLAVYPVALLAALAALDDSDAERLSARAGPLGPALGALRAAAVPRAGALRVASIAMGVALGTYTGILLSTLGARALWGSALLGPLFLVSGISTGAAFLLLFPLSAAERHDLARWDLAAIAAELVVLALLLAGLSTGTGPARGAAELLLGGRYTAPFWTLVVVTGMGVPATLEILERRLALRATVLAPVLVLAGGLALRWILVSAGQA
jgi:protein NrfD